LGLGLSHRASVTVPVLGLSDSDLRMRLASLSSVGLTADSDGGTRPPDRQDMCRQPLSLYQCQPEARACQWPAGPGRGHCPAPALRCRSCSRSREVKVASHWKAGTPMYLEFSFTFVGTLIMPTIGGNSVICCKCLNHQRTNCISLKGSPSNFREKLCPNCFQISSGEY
jgi:hypothetical protein